MRILFTALLLFSTHLYSQAVYEPVESDVYNFLERMTLKGVINFNFEIKPQLRKEIASYLADIDINNLSLTALDKELLKFYLKDYQHEISLIKGTIKPDSKPDFIITDPDKRLRLFEYGGNDFSFFLDPVLSFSYGSEADQSIFIRRNGVSVYGYVLGNWGYDVKFFDNEETGNNLDYTKQLSPERGTSITKTKNNSFEYDVVTANLVYNWTDGAISIGKDYFKIGSGNFGNVILYDQAPSFPFIRLDFNPVSWFRFFYFHGFLVSNVPDSSTLRYNQVEDRTSISDVPKFIAFHSLSFYPSNSFSFTLGESIVYSENLQPVYLIPVMFFRVADHYLGKGNASATGNAQLFMDFSYTNSLIRTKFYSSLFIDELSLNDIFEGGNLAAIGYTFGMRTQDLLIPNSYLTIEYSRINPFVYMNSVDAQTFANDDYKLGHWIGSNADIISFSYNQQIIRSLSFKLGTWYFRKGKTEEPDEQYQSPYPEFLYGNKRFDFGMNFNLLFRPWHPVSSELYYRFERITDEEKNRTADYKIGSNHYFGIRVSYGF